MCSVLSQEPIVSKDTFLRDKTTKDGYARDNNGNRITVREYHFINNEGVEVIIQEHSYGHSVGDVNRGGSPHFNVVDKNGKKTIKNTAEHYNF